MYTINPYLNFDGTCAEAFDFYKSVFGGEFSMLQTFADGPPEMPVAPADKDKVMHVSLPLGEDQVLMGSDVPSDQGPVGTGSSIAISIGPASSEEGRRLFEALATGGTILMAYEEQFWGSEYGMCVDRYGITWMIDYALPQE